MNELHSELFPFEMLSSRQQRDKGEMVRSFTAFPIVGE